MNTGKIVLKGTEATEGVLAGAKFLGECVSPTLGPFGSNGLVEKGLRITNDGVSIAREIQLDDEVQDLGLRKLREAASKTNDQVGDGTTTAITLAYEILNEVSPKLASETTVGAKSTAALIRQLHEEKDEVIAKLTDMATPIESEEALIHSAVVSVEDEELGKMIGEAQWKLGKDGRILAEETAEVRTYIEPVLGIRVDNGLGMTQAMNNLEKQSLELTDVPVVLTTNSVHTLRPLVPLMNSLVERGIQNLVIVARAFSEQAIRDVIANAQKGFNIAPINAPYTDQREIMKDLQAVLGGTFLDSEDGPIDNYQFSDLSHAKTISAKRYDAIFAGEETEEARARVNRRVEELQQQLKGSVSDFEKKNLEARIAQLNGGFALAKVGSISETERKRVFDKVEDAVNAVRAAFQEGTVPGAGLAFKEIADTLPNTYLLKRPLESIYKQIAKNAPKDFKIEPWVRDPIKVLRIALEQAVSVAGDLATVTVAVSSRKPKYNAFVQQGEETN